MQVVFPPGRRPDGGGLCNQSGGPAVRLLDGEAETGHGRRRQLQQFPVQVRSFKAGEKSLVSFFLLLKDKGGDNMNCHNCGFEGLSSMFKYLKQNG